MLPHGKFGNSSLGKLRARALASYSASPLEKFSALKISNATALKTAHLVSNIRLLSVEFTALKIDNPANGGIGT